MDAHIGEEIIGSDEISSIPNNVFQTLSTERDVIAHIHFKGLFSFATTRELDHRRDIIHMHAHALFVWSGTKRGLSDTTRFPFDRLNRISTVHIPHADLFRPNAHRIRVWNFESSMCTGASSRGMQTGDSVFINTDNRRITGAVGELAMLSLFIFGYCAASRQYVTRYITISSDNTSLDILPSLTIRHSIYYNTSLDILPSLLYKNQEAAVKTSCGTSQWFSIERGVRQGCIVSPSLFNIYSENIMREATENTSAGITIGGRKINNLRYADYTTLLCESKEDLMELLTRIQHLSKEKGLLLNTRKTKIMVVDKNRTDDQRFILNGEELEEVKSFVYLESLINTEVSCMPEVNRRLCMARSTIENMTTIWKSQTICKSLKLRIARATAFAVASYGCESWAYSKKVTKKIEAFEMWTYRRLLRVSWRQHKTNAWILEQLGTKPMLVKQMRKRKMKHFGHIIRHNSLEKTIIQGITAGKRGRGRPARTWEKDIEEWAGTNIGEATRMAERRDLWCTVIDVTAAQH